MWKTVIALAVGVAVAGVSDFVLADPAPPAGNAVSAVPLTGPDYWVGMGRERDLQFSRTEYARQLPIDVGNNGAPGQQQQLVSLVVSQGMKDLCSTSKAIAPPASRRGTSIVALQVVYAVPIDSLPANRKVTYKLVGTISPASDDVANEDGNTANNRVEVELQYPAGGKVRCVEM